MKTYNSFTLLFGAFNQNLKTSTIKLTIENKLKDEKGLDNSFYQFFSKFGCSIENHFIILTPL